MTWWQNFLKIFKSEAADVKEGLTDFGKTLDTELAKKEAEMAASPEERVDMILEEIEADDAMSQIESKIKAQQAGLDAEDEVEEAASAQTDREEGER
jgi:phosphosulfolactate synthase (CoM biosynthesis protein A)